MNYHHHTQHLIFFYIEHSSNDFIRQQGFNFSSNYRFHVEKTSDSYILTESHVPYIDQLPDDFFAPATDITAIVGKNGVGKTTLLRELQYMVGYPKTDDVKPGYEKYEEHRYESGKRLAIIMVDGRLICYHNLENLHNDTDVEERAYYGHQELTTKDIEDFAGFYGFTTVAYTAGTYVNDPHDSNVNLLDDYGISSQDDYLHSTSLNMGRQQTLSQQFYHNRLYRTDELNALHRYNDICDQILNARTFQQLLDVYYLNKWRSESLTRLTSWYSPDIQVTSGYFLDYIQSRPDNDDQLNDSWVTYARICDKLSAWPGHDLIKRLYADLLFEFILLHNDDNDMEKSLDDADSVIEFLTGVITATDDRESKRSYLDNALKEISRFKDIMELEGAEFTDNSLPPADTAYRNEYILRQDSSAYIAFLDFITEVIKSDEPSFILRYLHISGLTFSSGERTILNFFTWISLLEDEEIFFHKDSKYLMDNVLLLIDEADLYLHPEWQQKWMNELISSLDQLFAKDKHVQIIFSTHSPIMLSDMPKGNIIFLTTQDGRLTVDNPERHMESFGSSIYKLYDDAFFLEETGQMGAFARAKIKAVIDALQESEDEIYSDDRYRYFEQLINKIGEPLIREPLFQMLYRHSNDSRIGSLHERERRYYERRLRSLSHDTDKI